MDRLSMEALNRGWAIGAGTVLTQDQRVSRPRHADVPVVVRHRRPLHDLMAALFARVPH